MAHLPKGQGVVPMPPFKAFLATNIPAVYDNTMSYYDELTSLIKYLQDTVIPALNADSEAITVISNAMEQLQNYVDHYFENLDVQEEINNKLDQMAEDGTLQEIITTYIQANVAWTFDTVADMKLATNLVAGSYARTLGFRTLNDGGGAIYHITDTGTANEMDVIAIDDLYANLVLPTTVTPEMFGTYGDGTHDDTDYLKRCFAVAKNIKFGKDYVISSRVDIISDTVVDGNFHTVTNNTAINFFRANEQSDITVKNLNCVGDNTVSEAQIALNFVKCSNVHVENVDIRSTGGDGVSFGECTDCSLRNAYLKDNLISAFAYNGYRILFDNITVIKPRFQFGIQFKSCQDSTMSNIVVDTAKDCGVYVSKGSEEGSNNTKDIYLNNISVLNQGQDGTTSAGTQYAIVIANGVNHKLTNAYIYNSAVGAILLDSSYSTVISADIDTCAAGINCTGSNNKISKCDISSCTGYGIRLASLSNAIVSGNHVKDCSLDTNHANIELRGGTTCLISNNILEQTTATTGLLNILVANTNTGTKITGNTFMHPSEGTYYDYYGSYDFAGTEFTNNGECRFRTIKGVNSLVAYAEWTKNNFCIKGWTGAAPAYTGFADGDKVYNNGTSGYIGWVSVSGAWKGFGAIES